VSGVSYQRTEVRRQKTDEKMQDEATFLFSGIRLLTPDTRNLTPVLLKKMIDNSDPYFVNNFWDTTLEPILKK
jgi:hypothetical protein